MYEFFSLYRLRGFSTNSVLSLGFRFVCGMFNAVVIIEDVFCVRRSFKKYLLCVLVMHIGMFSFYVIFLLLT